MKTPTTPSHPRKPDRRTPAAKSSANCASAARRVATTRRNPRLPKIADAGPSPLTFGKIVNACIIPAYIPLILDHKTNEFFDGLSKRGYFIAGSVISLLLFSALAAAGIGVGAAAWGVMKSLAIVAAKLNRRKYLPREKERRRQLARERRRIRQRTTLNSAPTAGQLIEAWAHVRESPSNMIRFGSMLCDLEAYVDNSLIHDETGEICGRRPGIRGWLKDNCPELSAKYKTVMGYKAMANKFRQAMGLADPYPAALALELAEAEGAHQNMVRRSDGNGGSEAKVQSKAGARRLQDAEVYRATKAVAGWGSEARKNMVRRTVALLEDCGRSRRSVAAAIDIRVLPEAIPRIVEIAERREQGLPERDGPMMRLARRMA